MSTKLAEKEYSPMVVRKYTNLEGLNGLPVFVAIITDDSLSDLDETVHEIVSNMKLGSLDLQLLRSVAGILVNELTKKYKKAEGIAVVIFPDNTAISSLWGDFMNHLHCRMELYFLINTMWHL